MGKKVLVTGGAGFLGSHIADVLSESGHDVVVFDVVHSKYLRSDQKMIVGDILDRKMVNDAMEGIEVVYHLASIADIDVAKHQPYKTMEVNILGTINLLEASVKNDIEHFIFASSIYVYSNSGSFYRISKQCCETLLEEYYNRHELRFTTLRFGTLYGTRSDEHNSVYRYLKMALADRKIEYKGSGDEVREYIHVRDAAEICAQVISGQFIGESLIVTGQNRLKVIDMLKMIQEIFGDKIEIDHRPAHNHSHYTQTPYSYFPRIGKKIVSNVYCDIGQSLVEILQEMDHLMAPEISCEPFSGLGKPQPMEPSSV